MNRQPSVEAIRWQDNQLYLLDQRALPHETVWLKHDEVEQVVDSISSMVVRGAPAIGIAAAYGVVLAARQRYAQSPRHWAQQMEGDLKRLAASRPTAVNLFWALNRMKSCLVAIEPAVDPEPVLLAEAQAIHSEDIQANQAIGEAGADLIEQAAMPGKSIITHCNTGSLATGGYGTALGVIRSAYGRGLIDQVFADETRPWLQGSRLTAWELLQDGIPVTLNADSAAASLMAGGRIGWVIVGADRIAANGDVVNKIGTYSLAVLARHHGVKFMVAAPTSTFDMSLDRGADIPIEQRSGEEVTCVQGQKMAPEGIGVFNPVFDMTPVELVDAIVTEVGVVQTPAKTGLEAIFSSKKSGLG